MKHKRARGRGELGEALDALAEQHGTLTALAELLGCGIESLSRWIRGVAKPAPKYAERISTLRPDLRDLLTQHGCFTNPARRLRVFANRPMRESETAKRRRVAARKAAATRARKAKRLDKIKRRHQIMLRKAAPPRVRDAEPARRNRVNRGDFIERLDEMTAADARFVPTYEMEGL